jgi:hypothetical protein
MGVTDHTALCARLGHYRENPVTGQLELRNLDGPEAAAAVRELEARVGDACHVQIQPTTIPGAVAVVVFLNADVHQPEDEGTFDLTLGDLTVSVTIDADRSAMMRPDTMTVTPPAGYVVVPEDGAGQVVIYEGGVS